MNHPADAPLRVLIVDDEVIARATIRILLAQDPEVTIVAECASAEEALAAIEEHAPELVFLDVQMTGMDGFQLLEEVGTARPFVVIFVTAHDTHALRAFEVAALDYLLKPFDDERFAAALARAKAQLRQGRAEELVRRLAAGLAALPGHGQGHGQGQNVGATIAPAASSRAPAGAAVPERIPVRDGNRIVFVAIDEIDWIEAEDYYVQLHVGKTTHLLRESLRKLEVRLDPRRFVRIHRSTIVNVDRIRELEPSSSGESMVILKDGTTLRMSRRFRAELHALLGLS